MVAVLKYYVSIESNMINAERCMKLCDVIQEKSVVDSEVDLSDRPQWPETGEVEF